MGKEWVEKPKNILKLICSRPGPCEWALFGGGSWALVTNCILVITGLVEF